MEKFRQLIGRRSYPIDMIPCFFHFLLSVLSLGNFLFPIEIIAQEPDKKKTEQQTIHRENKDNSEDGNGSDSILVKGYRKEA